MLEVAEVFRRHVAANRAPNQLLPGWEQAKQDIEACRTPHFGGHLKQCDKCGWQVYSYRSCRIVIGRNVMETRLRELAQQPPRLLPCPYFLVTFTLPAELRPLALANQNVT